MRYALTLLLLTTLALAQGQPPASTSEAPSENIPIDQANQTKARGVMEQAIQALGGQAFLTFRDFSQEGRGYTFHHGEPNSLGTIFWRFSKYPDKDRIELTKKRDVIEVINGDKGYEITYKGVRDWQAKDELDPYLRRRRFSLYTVLREWLKDPSVALFYEGQTLAAQKETDQVTVMNSKNEAVTFYLDINSHLPVKKSFSWRDPTDKQRNTEEEIYDNYRSTQGIMTPFDVTRFYNGEMSAQSFITTASYNQGLDDRLFDPQQAVSKKH